MKTSGIRFNPETGIRGPWYVIDESISARHGRIFLLESEIYGDETACIIVDTNLEIVMTGVYNGFEDYFDEYEF